MNEGHETRRSGAPASFGAHLKAFREATGFTQEELATIAGLSVHAVSFWFADPTARLITLTGPGGVGKTRLALEIAEALGVVDATALELSRRAGRSISIDALLKDIDRVL